MDTGKNHLYRGLTISYMRFSPLHEVLAPLIPILFKGQQYSEFQGNRAGRGVLMKEVMEKKKKNFLELNKD